MLCARSCWGSIISPLTGFNGFFSISALRWLGYIPGESLHSTVLNYTYSVDTLDRILYTILYTHYTMLNATSNLHVILQHRKLHHFCFSQCLNRHWLVPYLINGLGSTKKKWKIKVSKILINLCLARYCEKVLTIWNSPKLHDPWIRFRVLYYFAVTTLMVVESGSPWLHITKRGWLQKKYKLSVIGKQI